MSKHDSSTDQNVASLMAQVARRCPNKAALVFEENGKTESISFGELWSDAVAFGDNLKKLGLQPSDRVIIMIPMSIDLYICLLGIIQMGGVVVFVDPWIGAKQIARFSEFAEPRAFIGINKSHLLRWSSRELRKIRISVTNGMRVGPFLARHSLSTLKQSQSNEARELGSSVAAVSPDHSALITFTSGSSGTPKGANRTHRFLLSQHLALKHDFPYRENDIDMPMFPVFALNNLVTGITSVVPEMDFKKVAEVDGKRILKQVIEHKITTCTASPPLLDRLAAAFESASESTKAEFQLRRILTGGAPVSDEQLEHWSRCFRTPSQPTELIIAYGSTEAEPVGHIEAAERLSVGGVESIGKGFCTGHTTKLIQRRLIPICKKAIDLSLTTISKLSLSQGEIGELIVAGDHVCRDYYKNDSATAENKLIDDKGTVWHRMGDTGYFDEQDRFWLVGRVHSTIVRDGQQIHPQTIEQIVKAVCPQITRAAAIGYDDEDLGELVFVIVHVDRVTPEMESEVKSRISQGLQDRNQVCDRVIVTDLEIPMDPRHNSKIDYTALKKLLEPSLRKISD